MGHLPWAGVHHQGVHEEHHRDQERVAAWGGPTLLQGQGVGRLYQQENAQEQGQGQGRIDGHFLAPYFC